MIRVESMLAAYILYILYILYIIYMYIRHCFRLLLQEDYVGTGATKYIRGREKRIYRGWGLRGWTMVSAIASSEASVCKQYTPMLLLPLLLMLWLGCARSCRTCGPHGSPRATRSAGDAANNMLHNSMVVVGRYPALGTRPSSDVHVWLCICRLFSCTSVCNSMLSIIYILLG